MRRAVVGPMPWKVFDARYLMSPSGSLGGRTSRDLNSNCSPWVLWRVQRPLSRTRRPSLGLGLGPTAVILGLNNPVPRSSRGTSPSGTKRSTV